MAFVDGIHIAVNEHRADNPALLIAFPGITEPKESIEAFALGIIEHLERVDLAAVDLYAQGESGGEWDLHAMIRGFGKLIDRYAESYERIILMGHSAGGIIAANASIDCRIAGMVIINAPARPQEAVPAWFLKHAHAFPPQVLEAGVKAYELYHRLTNGDYRSQVDAESNDLGVVGMRIGDPSAFLERLQDAPGLVDAAQRVTAPTLFVYGANQPEFGIRDGVLNASTRGTIERWNAHTDVSIIPGADHNLNDETWPGKWFNTDEHHAWVRDDIARWIRTRLTWP